MTVEEPPRIVGIAGDWHGNTAWAKRILTGFHEAGIKRVYHVGDFGIWPGDEGRNFVDEVHFALQQREMEMYIILGNHEDYSQVRGLKKTPSGWFNFSGYPLLNFAPRGHVWKEGNVRLAAMGGAGSIDRNLRTANVDWWADEEITDENITTLIANVQDLSWERVDVLLSHDSPAGPKREGITSNPSWITPDVENYCWVQRVRLRRAVDTIAPYSIVHGHWHEWIRDSIEGVTVKGEPYTTQIVGLACDEMAHNAIIATLTPNVGISDMRVLTLEKIPPRR